jgi:uncharacterized protein (TIGR01777 family)
MRVAVSGTNGFIGSALVTELRAAGHEIQRLVRGPVPAGSTADALSWHPHTGEVDARLAGVDAVVHLAAPGIGDRPWTPARTRELVSTRVEGTRGLATAVARLDPRPAVFVTASAIGYYGDTGDRAVDETSPRGDGFLAGLAEAWEGAAAPARTAGIRVVHARTGLVLAAHGGLLAKLLPLFRLGLGASLGTGKQYWSVISLADEVRALRTLVEDSTYDGPVNLVCPEPLPNTDVTAEIARALGRRARLRVPRPVLRAGGAQGTEMLAYGQRVRPSALLAGGFAFAHPTVREAVGWAVIN